MKMHGIWTSAPSRKARTGPKKSFLSGSGPWIINYRLSYKRTRSANLMKSWPLFNRLKDLFFNSLWPLILTYTTKIYFKITTENQT
jgi:hypothetical protein